MTIKLTVREAIAAYKALEAMPPIQNGKIAYTLGYIGDKLEPHVRTFDKLSRKLARELGTIDQEGNRELKAQANDEFQDQLEAAAEVEIEINREPVTLEEVLGQKEDRRPALAPGWMRALQKIILETREAKG